MRIGHAVRADETVVAEILVAGVEAVEVASIGVDHPSVLARPAYGLVHEVPDEASLVFRILADQVPILLEAALGIAHGMGVLALDERPGLGRILAVAHHVAVFHVHRAIDIGLAVLGQGPLILDGTRRIQGLDHIIGIVEIGARTAFIAKGPENHRRVVAVSLDVAAVPLDVRVMEERVLSQRLRPVTHAVRLDVRLGHDIDAVFVAEVVPVIVIGIVRGAYRIDIELLHDADVLLHARPGHDIAPVGVQFVPVRALEQNGLAVHQDLGVLYLHLAEAHLHRDHLGHGSLFERRNPKGIKIWCLGRPLQGVRHFESGI